VSTEAPRDAKEVVLQYFVQPVWGHWGKPYQQDTVRGGSKKRKADAQPNKGDKASDDDGRIRAQMLDGKLGTTSPLSATTVDVCDGMMCVDVPDPVIETCDAPMCNANKKQKADVKLGLATQADDDIRGDAGQRRDVPNAVDESHSASPHTKSPNPAVDIELMPPTTVVGDGSNTCHATPDLGVVLEWQPIPRCGISTGDIALILANGASDDYHCTLDDSAFTRAVRIWMVLVTEPYDPNADMLKGRCFKKAEAGGKRCFWKWDVEQGKAVSQTRLKLESAEHDYNGVRSSVLHVFKYQAALGAAPLFLTDQLRKDIMAHVACD
jgi:hypothetical protein